MPYNTFFQSIMNKNDTMYGQSVQMTTSEDVQDIFKVLMEDQVGGFCGASLIPRSTEMCNTTASIRTCDSLGLVVNACDAASQELLNCVNDMLNSVKATPADPCKRIPPAEAKFESAIPYIIMVGAGIMLAFLVFVVVRSCKEKRDANRKKAALENGLFKAKSVNGDDESEDYKPNEDKQSKEEQQPDLESQEKQPLLGKK